MTVDGPLGRPRHPVVLIEDDQLMGQALATMMTPILHDHGFEVLGLYRRVKDVVPAPVPGVAVCDVVLRQGPSAARAVRHLTSFGWSVLLMSGQAPAQQVLDAVHAGASGYLLKSRDWQDLLQAVMHVASAGEHLSADLAGLFYRDLRDRELPARSELSTADRDLLRMAAQQAGRAPVRTGVYRDDASIEAATARIFAAARARRERDRLSDRELDVVVAVGCEHLDTGAAAARLFVSRATINTHLQSIQAKYLRTHPGSQPVPKPRLAARLLALELNLCADREP